MIVPLPTMPETAITSLPPTCSFRNVLFAAAVQMQELALAVTVIVPVVPAAGTVGGLSGVTVKVHAGTPACVTVKVWPPNVMVPVRLLLVLLAGALKETVPLPVPEVGGAMVRKEAVVVAVQAQDEADAVKVKLPLPPVCGKVPLVLLRVKEQAAAAACVKVMVWPAIVSVAVRVVVAVLASTV
jgi:hypothetical protein